MVKMLGGLAKCRIRKVTMYSNLCHLCTEIVSDRDDSGLYRFHETPMYSGLDDLMETGVTC